MELSEFLFDVAATYERGEGLGTETQARLRDARHLLDDYTPGGILVQGSGGKGSATYTPWIGFFDPDETTSPEHGLYVVYLFAEDLETVYLTLNQGITRLSKQLGNPEARRKLRADAAAIRRGLPPAAMSGLRPEIELHSTGFRQRAYEAGNVAAVHYSTGGLPTEAQLAADLSRVLRLYQDAILTKRHLLQTSPGAIESSSSVTDEADDPLADFKPKNSEDYVSNVTGKIIHKSRRHEALIKQYGLWIADKEWRPITTQHPKDLVLKRPGTEWLFEAKVLYRGNATDAVRAALGQLFSYRYFLYPDPLKVSLCALFTESIGHGYADFLESHGVASVWRESGAWSGSATAVLHGLAD